MIGDTVAIEMPEAVSEQDEGRAVGACEAALGDDSCGKFDEGFAAVFHARVTASSELELTIELTLSGKQDDGTIRVLKFAEDEPEAFRWQSVGVVIAALVLSRNHEQTPAASQGERDAAKSDAAKPEPPKTAPRAKAEPADQVGGATTGAQATDVATIDVAPLVASSSTGAGASGGAFLGGAMRLVGPLYAVASGDVSFSAASEGSTEVRASAFGGSLGLGLRKSFGSSAVGSSVFGGELSARGALQGVQVRAESAAEAGEASTVRSGGRAGAALFWLPSGYWGVVLGGDVGLLWPPLDLALGAPEPTRISAVIWGGYLGLRIRLNRQ